MIDYVLWQLFYIDFNWFREGVLFEQLSYISQIIIAITAVLALLNFYQRKRDKDDLAIRQSNFFVSEILTPEDELNRQTFFFESGYRIETLTLKGFETELPETFTKQKSSRDSLIHELSIEYERIFNSLELFAVIVLAGGIEDNKIIGSLKPRYVSLFERHAYSILTICNTENTETFKEMKELYKIWRGEVKRNANGQVV